MLARFFKSERSQSMTEFALLAPILFLFLFGIVDLGRAVYYYVTITQAANEGARVAIIGEPPDYLQATNAQVLSAVTRHGIAATLGPGPSSGSSGQPCPNGPIPANTVPPANTGYVYITEYPAPNAYEASPPPNAPGAEPAGKNAVAPPAGCNPVTDAAGNVPLQVTVYYNFQPVTPVLQQIIGGHVILSAWAVYRTEY